MQKFLFLLVFSFSFKVLADDLVSSTKYLNNNLPKDFAKKIACFKAQRSAKKLCKDEKGRLDKIELSIYSTSNPYCVAHFICTSGLKSGDTYDNWQG